MINSTEGKVLTREVPVRCWQMRLPWGPEPAQLPGGLSLPIFYNPLLQTYTESAATGFCKGTRRCALVCGIESLV